MTDAAWIASDGRTGAAGAAGAQFPWWSFAKTVLAAAALRLAEQGRVRLDQPLPGRPFSLRQLLQHRAGVPDYGGLPEYREAVGRGDPPWPRDELLRRVRLDRLLFAPGRGWAYSNVGYMLVAELIEERSGRDLAGALQELVFSPLGLRSPRLAGTPADLAGLHRDAGGYHPGWVYHGCLVGTAADACALLDGLLQGRLLGRQALEMMRERHPLGGALPGRPWRTHGYGLGLMTGEMEGVGQAVGHTGGRPFSVSAVYHFPRLQPRCTVAAFCEGGNEGVAEAAAARLALRMA